MVAIPEIKRHKTRAVRVGAVTVGGGAPVVVQSMTNTDTADARATFEQIKALVAAGSEIVRVTVNNDEAARGVAEVRAMLDEAGIYVPLVGCFHYNGHTLLTEYPEMAKALSKYRINPGNVGFGQKRDKQFEIMIEKAIEFNKPVRIGVNWGSLDQDLATKLMDENAAAANPQSAEAITREALVQSALLSAQKAEAIGLPADKIILSAKVSRVQDLLLVYRELARRSASFRRRFSTSASRTNCASSCQSSWCPKPPPSSSATASSLLQSCTTTR